MCESWLYKYEVLMMVVKQLKEEERETGRMHGAREDGEIKPFCNSKVERK